MLIATTHTIAHTATIIATQTHQKPHISTVDQGNGKPIFPQNTLGIFHLTDLVLGCLPIMTESYIKCFYTTFSEVIS